jgi:leucyl aminopeptidase
VHVEATTVRPLDTEADTIVVGRFEDRAAERASLHGTVEALIESGEASGRLARLAVAHHEGRRIIVVGLGPGAAFDAEGARRAAAAACARATELSARSVCWEAPRSAAGPAVARGLVEGTLLRAYRFDRYKPRSTPPRLERLMISAADDVSAAVRQAAVVTAAQNRARDLANTPANDLPPTALAEHARRLAEGNPRLSVELMDGEQIRNAGMGAFAAVAQGSAQSARLIHIEYDGPGDRANGRLGLVGKAVTFDSGGLSLKSPASMHEMKFDMAGGAAVIEAMAALAELEVPGHVLGLVGATENLPSGSAVKPGDIVRALDGTTIEVNNTDAEGRLVLADCLCHARREGCSRLLDIATLTGAIVTALGSKYAGLMANDGAWAHRVEEAAAASGEPVWRLPLDPDYAQLVKGRYAQLTNRSERREAQAITAAELLHHFAGEVPWAHLDVAGTAYDVPLPYFAGKGATGFGVRLLVELVRSLS